MAYKEETDDLTNVQNNSAHKDQGATDKTVETTQVNNSEGVFNPWLINFLIGVVAAIFLYAYAVIHLHCEVDANYQFNPFFDFRIGCGTLNWLALFFKEIGFAGLVAVILNISIEAFNRRRHQKEKIDLISELNDHHKKLKNDLSHSIANDVFSTVYKRNIPEKMFHEVEYLLLKQNLHRSSFRVKFSVTRQGVRAGKVLLKRSQAYTFTNISGADCEIPIAFVSDAPPDTKCYFSYDLTIKNDGKTETYALNDMLKNGLAKYEKGFYYVSIPLKIRKGAAANIEETSVALRELIGSEAVVSYYPSDDMELTVSTPQCDFDISTESLHLRDVEQDEFDGDEQRRKWVLRYPILPGQGLMIMWQPKDLEASSYPVNDAMAGREEQFAVAKASV